MDRKECIDIVELLKIKQERPNWVVRMLKLELPGWRLGKKSKTRFIDVAKEHHKFIRY